MTSDTNTIQVTIPQGMDLQPATDALKRFGDVSHVEVFPGVKPILQVVFFDVRCAVNARRTLGPDRCKVAPQTGSRTVCLPGSMQLGADDLRNVSNVRADGDDALVAEFFDTRDAQRMQALVDARTTKTITSPPGLQLPGGLEPPPGLSPPGLSPPGLAPPSRARASSPRVAAKPTNAPVYLAPPSDVKLGAPAAVEPASSIPQESPDHFEVMLQSVPKALCCGDYLEAMLEQAGLDSHLVSIRVLTGANLGEALLKLSNKKAAKKCMKHFDGRRWDLAGNCPAVKATLLQAGCEVEKKEKKSPATANSPEVPLMQEEATPVEAAAIQYQQAMAEYFSSSAGQQLLQEEYCASAAVAAEEEGDKFNWDAVSDVSDGEHGGRKQRSALSDASTVDGSSDAGDVEVF